MKNPLALVSIQGFKTIKKLENLETGPLTVLIGPNGAGKSNIITFFQLLAWIL
jgi:predicted ATPase